MMMVVLPVVVVVHVGAVHPAAALAVEALPAEVGHLVVVAVAVVAKERDGYVCLSSTCNGI